MTKSLLEFSAGVLTGIGIGSAYLKVIRPWQLRWGATEKEIKRSMPGDDLVSNPSFDATRAVTIRAQPEDIYPWIVQIGMTRAGWYSYDILDNLGRPSAREIKPELQNIQIGTIIPMSPDGKQGLKVHSFAPGRWILWTDDAVDTSWAWGLFPEDNHTRLITRVRMKYRWNSPMAIFNLLIEFTDVIMMRKCMLGIKDRAETKTKEQ